MNSDPSQACGQGPYFSISRPAGGCTRPHFGGVFIAATQHTPHAIATLAILAKHTTSHEKLVIEQTDTIVTSTQAHALAILAALDCLDLHGMRAVIHSCIACACHPERYTTASMGENFSGLTATIARRCLASGSEVRWLSAQDPIMARVRRAAREALAQDRGP